MAIPAASISPYPVGGLVNEHRAAEILGLKVSTLRRWRWAGNGPEFVKIGAAVRYDLAVLQAFIAAGRRRSTSDTGDALPPGSAQAGTEGCASAEDASSQCLASLVSEDEAPPRAERSGDLGKNGLCARRAPC